VGDAGSAGAGAGVGLIAWALARRRRIAQTGRRVAASTTDAT
jgi:hypothetical protein